MRQAKECRSLALREILFSFTGPDGAKPTGPLAVKDDEVIATDGGAGSVFKFRLNF